MIGVFGIIGTIQFGYPWTYIFYSLLFFVAAIIGFVGALLRSKILCIIVRITNSLKSTYLSIYVSTLLFALFGSL